MMQSLPSIYFLPSPLRETRFSYLSSTPSLNVCKSSELSQHQALIKKRVNTKHAFNLAFMDKDCTCLLITTKQLCLQKGGIKNHLISNATNQPQELWIGITRSVYQKILQGLKWTHGILQGSNKVNFCIYKKLDIY